MTKARQDPYDLRFDAYLGGELRISSDKAYDGHQSLNLNDVTRSVESAIM